jgi:regulator of sigma E protease
MFFDFILTILLLIFILGLLVFIHELGHFLACKMIRVEVEEFAFGFGRNLISYEHGDTIYKINLFPFEFYPHKRKRIHQEEAR